MASTKACKRSCCLAESLNEPMSMCQKNTVRKIDKRTSPPSKLAAPLICPHRPYLIVYPSYPILGAVMKKSTQPLDMLFQFISILAKFNKWVADFFGGETRKNEKRKRRFVLWNLPCHNC